MLLFDEKIRQSSARPYSTPFWETPNRPPNLTVYFQHFLETGSLIKMVVSEEVRGLEVFLFKADQNFEHRLKI
jgi:hypothetical protein